MTRGDFFYTLAILGWGVLASYLIGEVGRIRRGR